MNELINEWTNNQMNEWITEIYCNDLRTAWPTFLLHSQSHNLTIKAFTLYCDGTTKCWRSCTQCIKSNPKYTKNKKKKLKRKKKMTKGCLLIEENKTENLWRKTKCFTILFASLAGQ